MLQYEQKVIRVDDMERFVNKNLFWIVFLLVQIIHKGILFILQKLNFPLEWSAILSKEFLLLFLLAVVEFIIIGFVLLGCVEPSTNKNYKIIRSISYILLGVIVSISLVGILAYLELIK